MKLRAPMLCFFFLFSLFFCFLYFFVNEKVALSKKKMLWFLIVGSRVCHSCTYFVGEYLKGKLDFHTHESCLL